MQTAAREQWRRDNPTRVAAHQLAYRQTEKGKAARRAANQRYRQNHADRVQAQMQAWLAAHPTYERDRAQQRYAANPAAQQARNRRWKANNPDAVRDHGARACSARRARKHGNGGGRLTGQEWAAIKADYDGRCAYCFSETPRPTQEHVVPLSKGGAHARANIVPACMPCNRSKGTKPLLAWLFPERHRRG